MILRSLLIFGVLFASLLNSGCGLWRNRPGILFPHRDRDRDCDRTALPVNSPYDDLAYHGIPTGFTSTGINGNCGCATGGISTGPIISGPMGNGPYIGGGVIVPPGGTLPSTTEPPKIPRIGVKEDGGGAKNTDPNEKESKRPSSLNPYEVLPVPTSGPKLTPTK
ncbi:MAG: hypothetical protein N2112_11740 [Gemmataceae bacterium]|jgi:hypothetical protein|nr:hypothetical protein [Gemmataceae bacterium]